jgi:histidyl-tRNA synthetase
LDKGLSQAAIDKVSPLFHFTGTWAEKLKQLNVLLADSPEGLQGVSELEFIGHAIQALGLQSAQLELDVTLARGLNYYTGAIFEVAAPKEVAMGSIGGGGRYDDLTGIFGLKNMSGVGISFGLDRIYLVLDELHLFPNTLAASCKALFVNYGQAEALYAMQAIQQLRAKDIAVELYPDAVKVGKQFAHADKRQIPFVVIAGSDEMQNNSFALKNLAAGTQELVSLDQLIQLLA